MPDSSGRGGITKVGAGLWLSNKGNERLADLSSNVLEGKVTMNLHNPSKLALTLTLDEPDLLKDWSDLVAPYLYLEDWAGNRTEHQLGLYYVRPGPKTHTQHQSSGVVEGSDLLWRLAQYGPGGWYNVATGVNIIERVRTLLASMGWRIAIPASSLTMPASKTWHQNVSWLTIINDLLNAANYYTAWVSLQGVVHSAPYRELDRVEPALRLFSGEGSPVIETIEDEGNYEAIANRVVVYKANPQGTPITAIRTNTNPLSPSSTVNVGFIKTRWESNANIATQTEADGLAMRLLQESASFTHKLKVTTVPLPDRALHEVYDLSIYNAEGKAVAFGLYWCDGWEIGFTASTAMMSHSLKRLEAYRE